jgi:hypothetical protein
MLSITMKDWLECMTLDVACFNVLTPELYLTTKDIYGKLFLQIYLLTTVIGYVLASHEIPNNIYLL